MRFLFNRLVTVDSWCKGLQKDSELCWVHIVVAQLLVAWILNAEYVILFAPCNV
jgi:hypothetical protein